MHSEALVVFWDRLLAVCPLDLSLLREKDGTACSVSIVRYSNVNAHDSTSQSPIEFE